MGADLRIWPASSPPHSPCRGEKRRWVGPAGVARAGMPRPSGYAVTTSRLTPWARLLSNDLRCAPPKREGSSAWYARTYSMGQSGRVTAGPPVAVGASSARRRSWACRVETGPGVEDQAGENNKNYNMWPRWTMKVPTADTEPILIKCKKYNILYL